MRHVLHLILLAADGAFQLKLASTANATFAIQTSLDAGNWTTMGSATSDNGGVLLFQDATAATSPTR